MHVNNFIFMFVSGNRKKRARNFRIVGEEIAFTIHQLKEFLLGKFLPLFHETSLVFESIVRCLLVWIFNQEGMKILRFIYGKGMGLMGKWRRHKKGLEAGIKKLFRMNFWWSLMNFSKVSVSFSLAMECWLEESVWNLRKNRQRIFFILGTV